MKKYCTAIILLSIILLFNGKSTEPTEVDVRKLEQTVMVAGFKQASIAERQPLPNLRLPLA
jgi:hypothetical protein